VIAVWTDITNIYGIRLLFECAGNINYEYNWKGFHSAWYHGHFMSVSDLF
jgi:hypothetical protein